jgi:hypothetical protein
MARPKRGEEHPRDEYRDKIRLMCAIGIPKDHIASLLRMGKDTLYAFYSEELETGASSANAVVGGKIFEAAKRGEQWACTLWAVRRMGWKETNTQEVTGKDGGPIEVADAGAGKRLLDELARSDRSREIAAKVVSDSEGQSKAT